MCVVETQVHTWASTKACEAHIPNRFGCAFGWRTPRVLWKSKSTRGEHQRKYQHIYSLINICMCTLAFFFMLFVAPSLRAGVSPVIFAKDMKKIPSEHAAPCNGNGGYTLPNWARIGTWDKYPGGGDGKIRNAIAFEDATHSRNDGAKAPIAIHSRILVRRGQPLPLGLSPRRM